MRPSQGERGVEVEGRRICPVECRDLRAGYTYSSDLMPLRARPSSAPPVLERVAAGSERALYSNHRRMRKHQ